MSTTLESDHDGRFVVRPLAPPERTASGAQRDRLVDQLSDVLVDCVDGGASVGFLAPLSRERAATFWHGVLDDAAAGRRVVVVAVDRAADRIVGTGQAVLTTPENQPHRAEIAKMLVHRSARRQGLGADLLRAAEDAALAEGRTLLVLDTASEEAARLYERAGWHQVGTIPCYALWPDGSPCDTVIFWKLLDSSRAEDRSGAAVGQVTRR